MSDLYNLKVGREFIRITEEDIKKNGIEIEDTGAKINFDKKIESLFKGKTFEDSEKVDKLIDAEFPKYVAYSVDPYLIENEKVPKNLAEEMKFYVKTVQDEISFDNSSSPFEYGEMESICTDYIYQYDGHRMTDYINEYADSQVNIYYSAIYANAEKFAECTEEALKEFGLPSEPELYKILQMGEFKAYEDALYSNLDEMGMYCACENALKWIDDNVELINKLEPYLTDTEKRALIDELEDKLEDIGKDYSNDYLDMGEYDEAKMEEIFDVEQDTLEKLQVMQEVMEGVDIQEFNVLNMDMDNDGVIDRYDMDFRDSDALESTYDVDDNLHQKEDAIEKKEEITEKEEKQSTIALLTKYKEEVKNEKRERDSGKADLER